jgi:methylmalonyl-CoA mutase
LFAEFPPVSTADWERAIRQELKGADPSQLVWNTEDGIPVPPFLRRENAVEWIALPSSRTGPWKIRCDIADRDNSLARQRADELVARQADAICFRGVPVENSRDLDVLLDGLPLDRVSIHFSELREPGAILSLLAAKPGSKNLSGALEFDPLSDVTYPEAELLDHFAAFYRTVREKLPGFVPLTIWGNKPGATVVQELALALTTGAEYYAALSDRGIRIPDLARGTALSFSIGSNYFFEIAKLRAVRKLWAMMTGAFDQDAATCSPWIHARTFSSNRNANDAHVNLVRGTTEAMAAIAGGCDSLTVEPFDAGYRVADANSHRLAIGTQLVLREEAHLDRAPDPAAGSWYVDWLTDQVAQRAWELFQQMESEMGLT